jgi:hypothetical protein
MRYAAIINGARRLKRPSTLSRRSLGHFEGGPPDHGSDQQFRAVLRGPVLQIVRAQGTSGRIGLLSGELAGTPAPHITIRDHGRNLHVAPQWFSGINDLCSEPSCKAEPASEAQPRCASMLLPTVRAWQSEGRKGHSRCTHAGWDGRLDPFIDYKVSASLREPFTQA